MVLVFQSIHNIELEKMIQMYFELHKSNIKQKNLWPKYDRKVKSYLTNDVNTNVNQLTIPRMKHDMYNGMTPTTVKYLMTWLMTWNLTIKFVLTWQKTCSVTRLYGEMKMHGSSIGRGNDAAIAMVADVK